MKTLSMVELRSRAEEVIRQVVRGQRFLLTYRGKPVARLEPVPPESPIGDDRFYSLCELADEKGSSITNTDIDRIVYGE
ncbi:MAG: type II toxin-antitoxin system Phd/YefM family antitoxin [Desulfobulbia bacterium]